MEFGLHPFFKIFNYFFTEIQKTEEIAHRTLKKNFSTALPYFFFA